MLIVLIVAYFMGVSAGTHIINEYTDNDGVNIYFYIVATIAWPITILFAVLLAIFSLIWVAGQWTGEGAIRVCATYKLFLKKISYS